MKVESKSSGQVFDQRKNYYCCQNLQKAKNLSDWSVRKIRAKFKRGKTSVEDKEYSGRDISSSLNEVQIYWLQGWSFWKIKEARPVLKIKSTVEETLAVV